MKSGFAASLCGTVLGTFLAAAPAQAQEDQGPLYHETMEGIVHSIGVISKGRGSFSIDDEKTGCVIVSSEPGVEVGLSRKGNRFVIYPTSPVAQPVNVKSTIECRGEKGSSEISLEYRLIPLQLSSAEASSGTPPAARPEREGVEQEKPRPEEATGTELPTEVPPAAPIPAAPPKKVRKTVQPALLADLIAEEWGGKSALLSMKITARRGIESISKVILYEGETELKSWEREKDEFGDFINDPKDAQHTIWNVVQPRYEHLEKNVQDTGVFQVEVIDDQGRKARSRERTISVSGEGKDLPPEAALVLIPFLSTGDSHTLALYIGDRGDNPGFREALLLEDCVGEVCGKLKDYTQPDTKNILPYVSVPILKKRNLSSRNQSGTVAGLVSVGLKPVARGTFRAGEVGTIYTVTITKRFPREHDYRLVARDLSGQETVSKPVTLRFTEPGEADKVEDNTYTNYTINAIVNAALRGHFDPRSAFNLQRRKNRSSKYRLDIPVAALATPSTFNYLLASYTPKIKEWRQKIQEKIGEEGADIFDFTMRIYYQKAGAEGIAELLGIFPKRSNDMEKLRKAAELVEAHSVVEVLSFYQNGKDRDEFHPVLRALQAAILYTSHWNHQEYMINFITGCLKQYQGTLLAKSIAKSIGFTAHRTENLLAIQQVALTLEKYATKPEAESVAKMLEKIVTPDDSEVTPAGFQKIESSRLLSLTSCLQSYAKKEDQERQSLLTVLQKRLAQSREAVLQAAQECADGLEPHAIDYDEKTKGYRKDIVKVFGKEGATCFDRMMKQYYQKQAAAGIAERGHELALFQPPSSTNIFCNYTGHLSQPLVEEVLSKSWSWTLVLAAAKTCGSSDPAPILSAAQCLKEGSDFDITTMKCSKREEE